MQTHTLSHIISTHWEHTKRYREKKHVAQTIKSEKSHIKSFDPLNIFCSFQFIRQNRQTQKKRWSCNGLTKWTHSGVCMVFVFWANVLFYLSSRFSSLFNGLESVFVLDLCYVPSLSLSLTLCGLALVSPRIDAKDAKQVCAFIFGFYCSRIFVDMKRILFAQCECERKSTRVSISWTGHISCRAYNTHTHEHTCIDRFGFMHSSKSNATNLGLKWVYSSFIVFGS